jgi:mannose-6-phosphate isomerase-like protein (cupin superfamily)
MMMKKNNPPPLLTTAAPPLLAAEPAGVAVWPAAELKAYGRKLAPKMNERKYAGERLGTYGNHYTMIAHREGDGEAELHEREADVFVVESGAATLVVGGEMVNGKTTTAGEVRGPSIKGGEKKPLATGDIVHIPARVPHQLLVPAGTEFTYFVIKVQGQ